MFIDKLYNTVTLTQNKKVNFHPLNEMSLYSLILPFLTAVVYSMHSHVQYKCKKVAHGKNVFVQNCLGCGQGNTLHSHPRKRTPLLLVKAGDDVDCQCELC